MLISYSEAMAYTDSSDLDAAVESLKNIAQQFAITLGPDGALVFDGNELIKIKPFHVKAVDTNGAGDLFAGSFLYGITHGMSYQQAGELASFASSRLVTSFGPRLTPALLNEVRHKMQES